MARSSAGPSTALTDLSATEQLPGFEGELASFITHPGVGRILSIRAGSREPSAVESCLASAGYQVGRLAITEDTSSLPQATATYLPDVVYVTLSEPEGPCLATLEALASDQRTQMIPLVALVPQYMPSSFVQEAYARSACDFFRVGATEVELLSRTHLLVRLSRSATAACLGGSSGIAAAESANASNLTRLDLCDALTGAYTATYFVHRLPTEVSRARRYHRDLSLVAISVPQAEKRDDVALRAARVIQGALRSVDLVGRIEPGLFAVLLPETRGDRMSAISVRIASELTREQIEHGIGTSGLDLEDDTGAYTSMGLLQAAIVAIRGRADGTEPSAAS